MRTIVSIASVCLFAAMSASAAITGYVMNGDGQAIAGAKVESFAMETVDAERARLASNTPERTPLASADSDARRQVHARVAERSRRPPACERRRLCASVIPSRTRRRSGSADSFGCRAEERADHRERKAGRGSEGHLEWKQRRSDGHDRRRRPIQSSGSDEVGEQRRRAALRLRDRGRHRCRGSSPGTSGRRTSGGSFSRACSSIA